MWQKSFDGERANWQGAKSYCAGLTLGGFSDWELPSKDILVKMIGKKNIFDSIERYEYWSSTPGVNIAAAWLVNFERRIVFPFFKSDYYYVRCVRGVN